MGETWIATRQGVEEIFDGAAGAYDRSGPALFGASGARLVEWLAIPEGGRVLDVGTGTGAVLIHAARRVGARGQVIGIDLSNAMLGEANKSARAAGLSNFELSRMDAEQLLFPDGVFDTVTCGMTLFFIPGMETALQEMRRVCKPGGQIGVTVWGPAPFDPAWKLFARMVRERDVEVRMPHKVAFTEPEITALLHAAGWSQVETLAETSDVVYPSLEAWWAFQLTLGSRAAIYRLAPEARAEFQAAYCAQLRPLLQADGLHLPAPVIYARGRRV